MGAYYDIYGFSKNRDLQTIESFIQKFTYREKVEKQDEYELAILKNEKYKVDEVWVLVNNLTEAIDYGLKNRNHGFTFYLGPFDLKEDIKSVILKFTYDSAIIFGLSIEEIDENGNDNYKRAHELEKELKQLFPIKKTSIRFEYPPSDDEVDFDEDTKVWSEMNKDQLGKIKK